MKKDDQKNLRSFVFFGRAGCLLPILMFFNLFFGWMFLRPLVWLAVGAGLVLLFFANGYLFVRRFRASSAARSNVVDVEAEIVEDRPRIE